MVSQINFFYVKLVAFSLVICVYSTLFYTMIHCQYNSDFASFYSAAMAARQGNNPYQSLMSSFLPIESKTMVNLNPPIILLLVYPLTYFTYPIALNIWLIFSITLGLIGAWVTFGLVFSQSFIKKNWLSLYIAYLLLFSTITCLDANQVGTLLMVCLMLGYYFYLKNYDYAAGVLWGFIITLKLFPGLLLFYVLRQNRLKLFAIMLGTIAFSFLIPLLIYGIRVYSQFYSALTSIAWYEHSWNASVLGFIHRVFIEIQHIDWIIPAYIMAALVLLSIYLYSLTADNDQEQINHQPFCLTLVMMLILSPLGWIYYFSILLFPLLLIWAKIIKEKGQSSQTATLWLTSLFFLNFPSAGSSSYLVAHYYDRTRLIPFYFLGALTLTYLLIIKKKNLTGYNDLTIDESKNSFLIITFLILAFSFIVPGTGFLLRLSNACIY